MPSYIYSDNYPITIGSYFYTNVCLTTAAPSGRYSDGTDCFTVDGTGNVTDIASCNPSYDNYNADRYDCSGCGFNSSGHQIALPSGTIPDYFNYYIPTIGSGEQGVYFYQITSTSSGPGIVCEDVSVSTCGLACPIP
jgi:hypothetical protein